jgi:phage terminase large subunit-like protein
MYRPSFIEWATSKGGLYLPDKRTPTLATWQPFQADILNHLFPAGEGRLPYSEVMWSEPKKSGKTQIAAGIQLYMGWFIETPGEQYVLANDLEGASDRTFQAIRRSLEHASNVKGSGISHNDWRMVGTKLILSNQTEIKALANDYKGGAGGNQSLASIDEVWGFTAEKDLGLLTEFAPVPTRENSLAFYTGYQGYEGDGSHWHTMIDNVLEHGEPVPELLHIEDGDGKPACWRVGRTFLFFSHLPRMPWHTEEYLAGRRMSMVPSEYKRVWENRREKNVNAFVTDEQWDALEDKALRALVDGDAREIVLGLDAATKDDTCAVAGVGYDKPIKRYEQVYFKLFRPEPGKPVSLTTTVLPLLIKLHKTNRIKAVYYDPFQLAAISELCRKEGINMVEFPQMSLREASDTFFYECVKGKNIAHYGDKDLKEHVTNAVAIVKPDRDTVRLDKKNSRRKIDGAVATSMALYGAKEELAKGEGTFNAITDPFDD